MMRMRISLFSRGAELGEKQHHTTTPPRTAKRLGTQTNMKTNITTNPVLCGLTSGLLLLAAGTSIAHANLLMNFDSVNASGGPIDATAYLASKGITLSGVTFPVTIISDLTYYGGGVVAASSGHNFLLQNTSGSPPTSYTLNFSTPLLDIGFTRIAQTTPNLVAQWTATAYAGASVVGSVGEAMFGGTEVAHAYTISGSGITSLTISANGSGSAGVPSAPLDDFVTASPVPEPATMAVGLLCLGAGVIRRRRRVTEGTAV